jgi:alpha-D-ribose 1-methylphosphonate 5-triphosphate synthase subunit PhnH
MMEIDRIWKAEAQQSIFRQLLRVSSLPGVVVDFTEVLGGQPAHLGMLATLLDGTTSLSDPDRLLDESAWRFLRAKNVAAHLARYVLFDARKPPPPDFVPQLGSLTDPECGAMLVLVGAYVGDGEVGIDLTGPGIKGIRRLHLSGFHSVWLARRRKWVARFPMGVDVLLTDSMRVAAIPRTTQARLL